MGNDDKNINTSVNTTEQQLREQVEKAKQEALRQAELQKQLQVQEAQKQQEFQAQQQAMQQQAELEKQQKEEAIKKEIAENNQDVEGGPNGFKRFMCFLLMAIFIAMVIFLPQITDFINAKIAERNQTEITTGILSCTLSKSTTNLDVLYDAKFNFVNSEVIKLTYTTTYTGDAEEDKEELTRHNNDCLSLKTIAANYDGISTSCNLNNGVSIQKQIFDYEKLDSKKVGTAYSEAGGTYPDFKKGDKISSIESKMIASGYECSKSGS